MPPAVSLRRRPTFKPNPAMAKNTIGNLHIEVDVALQKMQAQLDNMGKRVKTAAKKSNADFAGFAGKANAALATIGVGLSFGALTQGARTLFDYGAKITDLSKTANTSTDAFQALALEARKADVSHEQFAGTLAFLRKSLSESIAGMGEAGKSFRELGLDAKTLAKLPTERALELIARATAGADDKGTAYAHTLKILGEGSRNLQGLLETLARDGFEKVEEASKGLTLTPEQLKVLRDAKIEFERFGNLAIVQSAKIAEFWNDVAKTVSEGEWYEKVVAPWIALANRIPGIRGDVETVADATAGAGVTTADLADEMARVAAQATIAAEMATAFEESQKFVTAHIAEAEKLRADGVKEALALSERAARLGERQAQAALDALHPLDRAVALKDRLIGLEAQQAEVVGDTKDALALQLDYEERIFDVRQQLNGLGSTVDESLDMFFGDLDAASTSMEKLGKKTKDTIDIGKELGNTFSSAFEDAIVSGGEFKDMLRGLGQDILRLFVREQISPPIANFFSSAFSSLFGGGKAGGGDVDPSKFYLVGEEGPEAFIPDTAGKIIPAAQTVAMQEGMGGGRRGGDIYQIDARGADREGLNRLEAMIGALNGSIEHRALAAVIDGKRRRNPGLNGAFA
jgi:hypothetical protein